MHTYIQRYVYIIDTKIETEAGRYLDKLKDDNII